MMSCCCSSRPQVRIDQEKGLRQQASQFSVPAPICTPWQSLTAQEDTTDEEFYTPPTSPRAHREFSTVQALAGDCKHSEGALVSQMKGEIIELAGTACFNRMAEVYGGEEWMMLRFLRSVGGRKESARITKAVTAYVDTVSWRERHITIGKQHAKPLPPATTRNPNAGPCLDPLESELSIAAQAVLRHELKAYSPFRICPRPESQCVLLSANIDAVDIVPLRRAGFDLNFSFFVLVMECVQLLQRRVTCAASSGGAQGRCLGDVIVVDLAALAWRHIDPRYMHRVAVPILKAWQAHYPATLHKAYLLNVPRIFSLIWKIIRPVLADQVVAKITIATDDRESELRELLKIKEHEELPWLAPLATTCQSVEQVVGLD